MIYKKKETLLFFNTIYIFYQHYCIKVDIPSCDSGVTEISSKHFMCCTYIINPNCMILTPI